MAKLGEVCLLKAGKFVSANDISPEYNKGLYPCFGGNGIRGYVADYTHDGEFPLIGRQGALCGNVNLASGKFHATEHAVVVQPKIEMNVHWLYYALNAMNLGQYATGAAQPGLAVSKLETLSIEIPNISEQNKIAQTLYKVEQLVNFRKHQLAKLDELVKARFVEMFGDEQAFNKEPLSQNVEEMFIGPFGSSLKNESFVSKENGYCMVYEQKHAIRKTMDVETRYIDKPKYEELKRFSIHGGDIIVSCRGTIGETYIVPLNAPLGIMHPSIMKIRVKDSIYNRVFFDFLLQEKLMQHEAQANGSGVKMAVTASALGKEEFIVPSIPFQNQFAAFVERVDQQKQTVQQSLEKLELMKKALMQEYFG